LHRASSPTAPSSRRATGADPVDGPLSPVSTVPIAPGPSIWSPGTLCPARGPPIHRAAPALCLRCDVSPLLRVCYPYPCASPLYIGPCPRTAPFGCLRALCAMCGWVCAPPGLLPRSARCASSVFSDMRPPPCSTTRVFKSRAEDIQEEASTTLEKQGPRPRIVASSGGLWASLVRRLQNRKIVCPIQPSFNPQEGDCPTAGLTIPLIPESLPPPAMRLFASMLLTALHAFDAREGCDPRGNTTVVDILTRDPSFPCAAPRPGGWAWAGYPWLHRKPPPPSARRSILNPVRSAAGRKARALLLPP